MRYKWWDIGLKLGVPYHKLKEFEEEKNQLAALMNYWLNGNVKDVPVTWRSIVAALEASSVDESGLAMTLECKYCQSKSDSATKISTSSGKTTNMTGVYP